MRFLPANPVAICAAMFLVVFGAAGQTPAGPPPLPGLSSDSFDPRVQVQQTNRENRPLFHELDLLRRSDFSRASSATLSVRVQDNHGSFVPGLAASDFRVVVNDTPRAVRLLPPLPKNDLSRMPAVLLVLPPNQLTVHHVAIRDTIKYFSHLQGDQLPWKVGLFDSSSVFYPFTSNRQELLATLEAVDKAVEPLQYGTAFTHRHGDTPWLEKAEDAISNMDRNDGPRLIIVANPLAENLYGLNSANLNFESMANNGPQDLVPIADKVGAHIYIHNAGGPEPILPGQGDAAQGSIWGTVPSASRQVSTQQSAAYASVALSQSLMWQTAIDTLGGFSNSFETLSTQMQNDLDHAYRMEFDLTPKDQDAGIPKVEVFSGRPHVRMAIVDLAPVKPAAETPPQFALMTTAAAVLHTMKKPLLSPDFRISQHVDYFPVRSGQLLTPVLPMTCEIEWTGTGPRPQSISVAESFVDQDLATAVLERDINAGWQERTLRWIRQGELHPGRYEWLVAVHDASGKILSSSRASFTVAVPMNDRIGFSDLVTGVCRAVPGESGLKRRTETGSADGKPLAPTVRVISDPLQLDGCRLSPESNDGFAKTESLRALLRIYPAGKLEKQPAEAWSAHFTLRSAAGGVEATSDSPLKVDKGSGLTATASIALNDRGISPGEHTLDLEIRGPGIRHFEKRSRTVFIAPSTGTQ